MPPSIPTSFIPHPASSGGMRGHGNFMGVLAILAYLLLALTVAAAIGVFIYGRILNAEQSSQDAALAKAETGIDQATVVNFVRLRDRLTSSNTLLNNHVALSNFFTVLENLLITNVSFTSLHINNSNGNITLDGSGAAKTFNALAAASDSFATDGRIKNAIFSSIAVGANGFVTFSLSATLDPKLIAYAPPTALAPVVVPTVPITAPAATSSSATSSPKKP